MFISLVFSIVIYANVDRELVKFEKFQQLSRDRAIQYFGYLPEADITSTVDQQLINEARGRLIGDLAILNVCILLAAGAAGYFLAGRTLTPIRKMLDDQSRFFGDASHELKTPLTALRSEIEIFQRAKKHTMKEAEQVISSNLEEVERLQNLTTDFLSLATLEADGFNLEFENVNIKKVITEAIFTVESQAKYKMIEIINKSPKINIQGNEKSLIKLFSVLIDNAVKYSPNKSKITIRATALKKSCIIKVIDNGIGIPEEDTEHIFKRFYRSDKSRQTFTIQGYGLGLSIAKEIVEIHRGQIQAQNNKKGSTFVVELPFS